MAKQVFDEGYYYRQRQVEQAREQAGRAQKQIVQRERQVQEAEQRVQEAEKQIESTELKKLSPTELRSRGRQELVERKLSQSRLRGAKDIELKKLEQPKQDISKAKAEIQTAKAGLKSFQEGLRESKIAIAPSTFKFGGVPRQISMEDYNFLYGDKTPTVTISDIVPSTVTGPTLQTQTIADKRIYPYREDNSIKNAAKTFGTILYDATKLRFKPTPFKAAIWEGVKKVGDVQKDVVKVIAGATVIKTKEIVKPTPYKILTWKGAKKIVGYEIEAGKIVLSATKLRTEQFVKPTPFKAGALAGVSYLGRTVTKPASKIAWEATKQVYDNKIRTIPFKAAVVWEGTKFLGKPVVEASKPILGALGRSAVEAYEVSKPIVTPVVKKSADTVKKINKEALEFYDLFTPYVKPAAKFTWEATKNVFTPKTIPGKAAVVGAVVGANYFRRGVDYTGEAIKVGYTELGIPIILPTISLGAGAVRPKDGSYVGGLYSNDRFGKISGVGFEVTTLGAVGKEIKSKWKRFPIGMPYIKNRRGWGEDAFITENPTIGNTQVGIELTTFGNVGEKIVSGGGTNIGIVPALVVTGKAVTKAGEWNIPRPLGLDPTIGRTGKVKDLPIVYPTREGIAALGYGFTSDETKAKLRTKLKDKPFFQPIPWTKAASQTSGYFDELGAGVQEKTGSKALSYAPSLAGWVVAAPLMAVKEIGTGIEMQRPEVLDKKAKDLLETQWYGTEEPEGYTKGFFNTYQSTALEPTKESLRKQAQIKVGIGTVILGGIVAKETFRGIKYINTPIKTRVSPVVKGSAMKGQLEIGGVKGTGYKMYAYKGPVKELTTTPFKKFFGIKPSVKNLTKPQIYFTKGFTPRGATISLASSGKVSNVPYELSKKQLTQLGFFGKPTAKQTYYMVSGKTGTVIKIPEKAMWDFNKNQIKLSTEKVITDGKISTFTQKVKKDVVKQYLNFYDTKSVASKVFGTEGTKVYTTLTGYQQVNPFTGTGKKVLKYPGTFIQTDKSFDAFMKILKKEGLKAKLPKGGINLADIKKESVFSQVLDLNKKPSRSVGYSGGSKLKQIQIPVSESVVKLLPAVKKTVVSKVIPIIQQKSILDIFAISALALEQQNKLEPVQKVKFELKQVPDQPVIDKTNTVQGSGQVPGFKVPSGTIEIQIQPSIITPIPSTTQTPRLSPPLSFRPIPKIIPPPSLGNEKLISKLKKIAAQGKSVDIVTGMKINRKKTIGKNLPPFKALKLASEYVDRNIEASFRLKVNPKPPKVKDIPKYNPGRKFRPSKRDTLYVVERKQFRLDMPGEKRGIKKSKSIKKPTKTKRINLLKL